ncbi:1,4-alpha-glucan branching protein GlgB [Chelativorans sp. ZYF759]|uniref:1,4-alpha-glucan branching protein GlgB n=1 Tax=Chelativorans sp. ZYF759 TaxID=2692213 RepID=UPI00145D9E7D|nr:1,4-alpha-glucan branching protein GlgB [Chelativorans sp. ZYF759]NMG37831.1 1,4-alpha-glucan branching protein GlgB [Chelativorans sp. ZYF759]
MNAFPDDFPLAEEALAIVRGRHGNPFAVLGMHGGSGDPLRVNVFAPAAASVTVLRKPGDEKVVELARVHPEGFFSGIVPDETERFSYRLRLESGPESWIVEDPYAFGPVLGDLDEHLFAEGKHLDLYRRLGSHPVTHEGVEGVAFAVWAPNARRVSVVGNFNAWDGRRHPMRRRLGGGIWELFIPGLPQGEIYKYEIVGVHGEVLPLKADPVSQAHENPPATASVVSGEPRHDWQDDDWLAGRPDRQRIDAPISIYELHLGSWRRSADGDVLDYEEIADHLIPYIQEMGFTHVELLPVTEHPFSGSWGYQPIGLFAPTRRFGPPEAFASFVDRLHAAGIGVMVDWVPAHFPSDAHGLVHFDGTALYEHEDPRLGFHQDWNTLIYNFGRIEVSNFLQASALYWIDQFHIDGLRVDAVASMLYLDYSRNPGEWIPNRYGGNQNLDAIEFLQQTNTRIAERHPGALAIAEESTAFPGVSRPVQEGGLGFHFKWNMGWMHDTLEYMSRDPIHRRHHHHQMTFGMVYAFSENFVLPLSHDEVVHGKGSLIGKMPGDRWQKFANLRAYYTFMWAHPGKKLLFMGGEFAQDREWNHDQSLDWHLLDDPMHAGVKELVRELNRLYREWPALHELDCEPAGFEWIESNDSENSVFSFLRRGRGDASPVLVVCNLTPIVRHGYRLGVPVEGPWRTVLNSDDPSYGGSGVGNGEAIPAQPVGWHGRSQSIELDLPPLGALLLVPES